MISPSQMLLLVSFSILLFFHPFKLFALLNIHLLFFHEQQHWSIKIIYSAIKINPVSIIRHTAGSLKIEESCFFLLLENAGVWRDIPNVQQVRRINIIIDGHVFYNKYQHSDESNTWLMLPLYCITKDIWSTYKHI